MTTHNHVDELIAGYLLGAIEPGESERVRMHVDECAGCQRMLAETRDVLAALPDEVDELSPRNSLKAKIIAAAQADIDGAAQAETKTEPRPAADTGGTAPRARFGGALPRWAPLAAVSAIVVVAFASVLGWAITLNDRIDQRDERIAQLQTFIDAVPRSQTVLTMGGTDAAPQVHAALVVADGDRVHVIATDVPLPEAGSGYHLWLFENGEPVHAAVLQPDERGFITAVLEADLAMFDSMLVDLQPVDATTPGGVTVLQGGLN
jgi:anti-sigma-K factor RskA